MRSQISAALRQISPGERVTGSAQARSRLAAQTLWQAARWVVFFAPMPEELDVWPLVTEALSAGKKVALPRFVAGKGSYEVRQVLDLTADVRVGHFGIREPQDHCPLLPSIRLDLILVPGVAFDSQGRRLGRGKGYYDHLLTELPGTTCGVAFDQQVVDEVPAEAHDVRLNYLLTPTRWVQVPPGG